LADRIKAAAVDVAHASGDPNLPVIADLKIPAYKRDIVKICG
jgi:hypothetical protein